MATEPEIVPLKFDPYDLEPLEDYRANLNLYHEALKTLGPNIGRVFKAFMLMGKTFD